MAQPGHQARLVGENCRPPRTFPASPPTRADQEIYQLVQGRISSPYWAKVITDDLRHRRDTLLGRRGGADPDGTLPDREQAWKPG